MVSVDTQANTRLSAGSAQSRPLVAAPAVLDIATDTHSDDENCWAAKAKRYEAQTLVVDGPCRTHEQCGALAFQKYGPCRTQSYVPYLLASLSAEAAQARTDKFKNILHQEFTIGPMPENSGMCISRC